MITLIHGDDQVRSRAKLNEVRHDPAVLREDTVTLDGDQELLSFRQAIESQSLFHHQRQTTIENLFSQPKSSRKEALVRYLFSLSPDENIVIWEKKALTASQLKKVPHHWKIWSFPIPVLLFRFLDSIRPGNQTQFVPLFHQVIASEPAELVFYLLAKRWRQLIIAKNLGPKNLGLPPWQAGRLAGQTNGFTLDFLKKQYLDLLVIEDGIKTGRSLMPLDWHLDLWLINI